MSRRWLIGGGLATLLLLSAHLALAFGPFSLGSGAGTSGTGEITTLTVFNSGGSSISNAQVTYEQPFQTGDIPTGNKIQIRKSDNATLVTTQEDQCSTWIQDGSRKACRISFIEPDTITAGGSATYHIWSVVGSPSTTPNVTTGNITANTNFILKATAQSGNLETGTWDFIGVNYVLNNCTQYNGSTGYGSNPTCGWDVYATGPNDYGLHLFQYAIRESDSAVHDWIRTDAWIDFWGSGSTPCPCSIAVQVSQPNTFGKVSAGSVGSNPEGGYTYGSTLYNGATSLFVFGGSGGPNVTNLTSSAFNTTGSIVTLANNNWLTTAFGTASVPIKPTSVVPITISSSGSLPTGLSAATVYWMQPIAAGTNTALLATLECYYNSGCGAQATFSTQGSGTITITPLNATKPFGGWLGLDAAANRIWVSSGGAQTTAPTVLAGHNLSYLTQKSKAVPPYINGLSLASLSTPSATYFPYAYFWLFDINTSGDNLGDERIAYINHSGIYSIYSPFDIVADQNARGLAASFSRQHMYHIDETVGLPVVLNNGHAKNGTTYATLGAVQPGSRDYPYNTGSWMTPSTASGDLDNIYERYGNWLEPSHMPAPAQAPLLKTGQPEWENQLVIEAQAIMAGLFATGSTIGSNSYYRVMAAGTPSYTNNQTRGVGWGGRVLFQANYFLPASSPMSQYFSDLVSDNGGWLTDWLANVAVSTEKSLGYWPGDVEQGEFQAQFWQDDFFWLAYGIEAWRNEYASYSTWITTQYYKFIITRMDPSSGIGGGGCLWAAPSRFVYFYNGGTGLANLNTTWTGVWTRTQSLLSGTEGWSSSAWTNCAAAGAGVISDSGGTTLHTPVGLPIFLTTSAAIGTLLSVADSSSLYTTLRGMSYADTPPLSFTSYAGGGVSYPEFAIGPLGATQ